MRVCRDLCRKQNGYGVKNTNNNLWLCRYVVARFALFDATIFTLTCAGIGMSFVKLD